MYANLRVKYRNSKGIEREVYASEIEKDRNVLVITLDDDNDESSYAAPVGERRINPANLISVAASF
jgi:hypothetical protein